MTCREEGNLIDILERLLLTAQISLACGEFTDLDQRECRECVSRALHIVNLLKGEKTDMTGNICSETCSGEDCAGDISIFDTGGKKEEYVWTNEAYQKVAKEAMELRLEKMTTQKQLLKLAWMVKSFCDRCDPKKPDGPVCGCQLWNVELELWRLAGLGSMQYMDDMRGKAREILEAAGEAAFLKSTVVDYHRKSNITITEEQLDAWLEKMIRAENLYPEEFERTGISDIIEGMRKIRGRSSNDGDNT